MEFIKSYYPFTATTLFVLCIIVAHIFAGDGYDWTKNTISDLGAQGYERKVIMQTGFLAFGGIVTLGILLSGPTWRTAPFLIYGLCVALTGVFCTKPFAGFASYSQTHSMLHSAFAQIAGVAFSIGILLQLLFTGQNKLTSIHLLFFVLVIGLSITFGLLKNYQGVTQRFLYLVSFIWFVKYYRP